MMMIGKTVFPLFTCSLLIFLSVPTTKAEEGSDGTDEPKPSGAFASVLSMYYNVMGSGSAPATTQVSDAVREAPEIIESRGFVCQTHEIPTPDGYLLTTHRIVNPAYLSSDGHVKTPKRPIILQHGVLASSVTFIVNSVGGNLVDDPDERDSNSTMFDGKVVGKNIGFELAKRGYDVWMPNHRGNVYTKAKRDPKYKKEDPNKSDWDFCFDSMAEYDNPAVIEYVKTATGRKTVGYIAHSQGTLAMFELLATQPKYNEIVKPFIALAPIGSLTHTSTIVRYFAYIPMAQYVIGKLRSEFLSKSAITRFYSSTVCTLPFMGRVCNGLLQSVGGWSEDEQTDMDRLPVYLSHFPSGTSGRNLVHFRQAIRSGLFSKFDYESDENTRSYGGSKPPPYPFENITNPDIVLFTGDKDAFATPKNVEILRNRLTVKPKKEVRIAKFNHLDFLLGKDAGVLVNAPVLEILSEYDSYE